MSALYITRLVNLRSRRRRKRARSICKYIDPIVFYNLDHWTEIWPRSPDRLPDASSTTDAPSKMSTTFSQSPAIVSRQWHARPVFMISRSQSRT